MRLHEIVQGNSQKIEKVNRLNANQKLACRL
jgi:hypothetical protein